jgi:hypothetical protein
VEKQTPSGVLAGIVGIVERSEAAIRFETAD